MWMAQHYSMRKWGRQSVALAAEAKAEAQAQALSLVSNIDDAQLPTDSFRYLSMPHNQPFLHIDD